MPELLESLNTAQRDAVVNYDCPSLIVAGAGSGKTRVLTSRIAYMLRQGVEPWRILALTFTNKAAEEMRERISQMVSKDQSRKLWMGTFHSIFLRILRNEADKLNFPSSFTIYDSADSRNLIRTILKEMDLSDEFYKPNAIQSRISLAKNNLVTPQAYESNAAYVGDDRKRRIPEFGEVYKRYAARCKENGAMDFDDLLLNINILFKDFPDVLAKYQKQFQYLLVDEYQDTNYAQYIIIRRLVEKHSKVCVVGDDAQSIYSFRGAKIENILRFRNDFPDAKIFKLEHNYRSTQTIVNAANSVIERNTNRIDKSSFSVGEEGEKIKVLRAYTDQEEAGLVANQLMDIRRETDAEWNEFAILYRTNMQSRVFEEAFRRRAIPHKIYGGMSFYQRKEVKDVLAYLQLIVNPRDDESFKRIVNYPTRGIGNVTLSRLADYAALKGISMFEAADTADLKEAGMAAGAQNRIKEFIELIRSLSSSINTMELYEFGLEVATKSGIIGSYRVEQTPEAQSALDNIEELLNSMQLFSEEMAGELQFDELTGEPLEGIVAKPSITDWLQSVTLLTDMDNEGEEDNNKVTLMTVHAAKGLEYRFVFIVGLEENLFPSIMSLDSLEGQEEERRLFYVALTRAQEAAVLSFSQTRFKWGNMEFCRPSRFLSEINPKYLEISFELDDEATAPSRNLTRQVESGDDNRTVRGAAAERYRSAGARGGERQQRGQSRQSGQSRGQSRGQGGQNQRSTDPAPKVGLGTRFRSIGVRPASEDGASQVAPPSGSKGYTIGQRVSHKKFGEGTINDIERTAVDHKLSITFDEHGKKTLLSKFAKLVILD